MNIQIKQGDQNSFISNQKVIQVIEHIISEYPFTFISKERVHREIDQLEECFWMKDVSGKFVLVNTTLAEHFGLRPFQLEGKYENSFYNLPGQSSCRTIEFYIRDSSGSLSQGSLSLKGILYEDYHISEIPLTGEEGSAIGIIGIAEKKYKEEYDEVKEFRVALNLIKNLPYSVAFINNKGIFRQSNHKFCKLFSQNSADLTNYHYSSVLSKDVAEVINRFIDSDNDEDETVINTGTGLKLYLSRLYSTHNHFEGILVLAKEKETKESPQLKEKMIEDFILNYPEPIFIYDKENLSFLEVNQSALALYGYAKDEFLQMDITDLYAPEDIQTLLASSEKQQKEGEFQGPFRHRKKDGASILIEVSKIHISYNGKDAYLNVLRDVTERLEQSKKTQLFKASFENTSDPLFITDKEGFIYFINNPVSTSLGFSKKDLENTSFASLFKDEERGNINTAIFQSYLKETISITSQIKNAAGGYNNVELIATPILDFNNEVESFSIIARIELKHETPSAEEVKPADQKAGGETAAAPAPVESIDSAFLASVFHEILTPINVIVGFVQDLTESNEKQTPEQKEAVDIINQNKETLLSTLDSYMEYSAISSDQPELNIQNIGIVEIIDYLKAQSEKIKVSPEFKLNFGKISSSLKFQNDKQKFQKLIWVLLKITAKLSKEKNIYISSYPLDDVTFLVSLREKHSSMSKNLVKNMDDFFEGDETLLLKEYGISKLTAKYGKSLLRLLNGTFMVFDDAGKQDAGFVFPIKSLLAKSEPDEPESKSAGVDQIPLEETVKASVTDEELIEITESKATGGLKLTQLDCLYIEDQVDSQVLFKIQMKDLKEIEVAGNYNQALPLLNKNTYSFIVVDINLPGDYNGLDILKVIRKMPKFEQTPVIACTAYLVSGDREKFLAAGFSDFIPKPVLRDKLISSLQKFF